MQYPLELKIEIREQGQPIMIGSKQGSSWLDLGILLESLGVMMSIIRQKDNWNRQELANYCKRYIDTVSGDFDKSYNADERLKDLFSCRTNSGSAGSQKK